VHRVLAAWDFDVATLSTTISRVLEASDLPQDLNVKELRTEMETVVAAAAKAGLFDEIASATGRLTEFPLAARLGDFVVDGIIDGILPRDDGTVEIIDYKTDRVGKGEVAETAAHYEWQQAAYAVALAATGRTVSRVSLVFLRALERHTWVCDARQLETWGAGLAEMVAKIREGEFELTHDGPCRCGMAWVCGREPVGNDLDLS
jgi:ATP-dependent helicase/nuclease subunit A